MEPKILSTDEMEDLLFDCIIPRACAPNVRDYEGRTLLHYTAELGWEEETEFLLSHISPNVTDNEGRTPLHLASTSKIVELLLKYGADVNARDNKGRTPLHYARNAKIAKILIEYGADPNAKDNEGNRPLHYVHNAEIAKILIEYGADPNARNNKGLPPIYYSLVRGDCRSAAVLIHVTNEDNLKVKDQHNDTLLHWAVRNVCRDLIRLLHIIDVNAKNDNGDTALHVAGYVRDIEMIKLLLEQGANLHIPNRNNITPLMQIGLMCRDNYSGCAEVVKMIIDNIDVNYFARLAFNEEQLKLLRLLFGLQI